MFFEWVIQWARGPSGTLGPIPHPAEGQAGQAFCSEVVQLIQGSLPKAESQVDALVLEENDTYGLDYGLKDGNFPGFVHILFSLFFWGGGKGQRN